MVIALVTVIGVIGAVVALLGYDAGRIEAGELFDAKLAHSARVLQGLAEDALAHGALREADALVIGVYEGGGEGIGEALATPAGHAYETKLTFQAWRPDGTLLLRSSNAPAQPLAPRRDGFARVVRDGSHWRTFTLGSADGHWYQVGERDDIRDELAGAIAMDVTLPLLLGLPILAVLAWLIVDSGCRPLRAISAEVSAQAATRLQPIAPERVPTELSGLIAAINGLFARVGEVLSRERRFTADAAHELRTPVAVLRVQLENLEAAGGAPERDRALFALRAGVDRLQHLIEQLLQLARLDPDAGLPTQQRFELAGCVANVVEDLQQALGRADLALECVLPPTAGAVRGDPVLVAVLVRNLVDNALRYTPAGGTVRIAVTDGPGGAVLTVEDSGPGIPAHALERVRERFHRELGSGADGSGLGLSIAQRIAELHGATLDLQRSEALGGLQARVGFPPATGPTAPRSAP